MSSANTSFAVIFGGSALSQYSTVGPAQRDMQTVLGKHGYSMLSMLGDGGNPAGVSSVSDGRRAADFLRSHLFVRLPPRPISGSLSVDDVKRIAGEGFTVGGHTVHHSLLSDLRDGPRLRGEIIEDKESLEKMTGRRIEYFAYPSGEHNNPDIDLPALLKEAGYKGAVTTAPGFNDASSNPFRLHRELTDAGMPGSVFRARVRGNGDGVRFLKARFRKSSAP